MSEIYELKKTVNISYPGKNPNKIGKDGLFLCPQKDGKFDEEKDTFARKDRFSPSERESFYGHVKSLLQSLETKFPPSFTVQYKEAELQTNPNDPSKSFLKLVENGNTLKESLFNSLPEEEKKNYKKVTIPELSYRINASSFEKDGKPNDYFELVISTQKHEAIKVNFNKNCEAYYITYNANNTFVNNKPASDSKWVKIDNTIAFQSETLKNFAMEISSTLVRTERTGRSFPSLYTEVNNYVKENSPKIQNSEGKEVSEYYSTGFHFANSVMKDKDGNALKDENGNDRKYARDCFSFMNHSSESITFNLQDGDICGIYYKNFESGDSKFSSDRDAFAKITESCIDKGFTSILNDALVNYSKNMDKANLELANENKEDEMLDMADNIDKEDMPF